MIAQRLSEAPTTVYLDVDEARGRDGLRLVLSRGVPGPWGEAAKGILHVKGIDYSRVTHLPGQANESLKAWTGLTSAPIAILDDEPPRGGWIEILLLAERLQPEPRLIPQDEAERARMFGLAHELCSEDGFGWNRRILLFRNWSDALARVSDPVAHGSENLERLQGRYAHGANAGRARERLIAVLGLLDAALEDQAYFVGDRLSALDIYWACFCGTIHPLPDEMCRMGRAERIGYTERDPDILAALTPALLAHRDRIYRDHLQLPMRF